MSAIATQMPLHQRAMHTIMQLLQQVLQHAQGKLPPWAPAAAAAFVGQHRSIQSPLMLMLMLRAK